jgi:hypothetical protein
LNDLKCYENIIILKSDKVNAVVVMNKTDYYKKGENFIKSQGYQELKRDLNEKYYSDLLLHIGRFLKSNEISKYTMRFVLDIKRHL